MMAAKMIFGFPSYYKLLQAVVGQGSFGKCVTIFDESSSNVDSQVKVLKEIELKGKSEEEDNKLVRSLEREAQYLITLRHDHILRGFCLLRYDRLGEGRFLGIITEFCKDGNLGALINSNSKNKQKFNEIQILPWLFQLASALAYLHRQGVVHCDINPNNLFLMDNLRTIKIGDLGSAQPIAEPETAETTFNYKSPEIFKCKVPNPKVDCWALGCVIYEMVKMVPAFRSVYEVILGQAPPLNYREYDKFYARLMEPDPEKRMSSEELDEEVARLKNIVMLDETNYKEYLFHKRMYGESTYRLLDDKALQNTDVIDAITNTAHFDEDEEPYYYAGYSSHDDDDDEGQWIKEKKFDKLKEFKYRMNQLSELTPGLFSKLGHLYSLQLQNNQIKVVRANVFDALVNLRKLNLKSNGLTAIEESAFEKLVNLRSLNLESNEIRSMASIRGITRLVSLRRLYLDINEIRRVDADSFKNLSNLKKLTMSIGAVPEFDPAAFAPLVSLEDLKISHDIPMSHDFESDDDKEYEKRYEDLEKAYWNGDYSVYSSTDLYEMCYDSNGVLIKPLDQRIFSYLPSLKVLDISDIQNPKNKAEAFGHLKHLKILPNSFNKLIQL